MAERLWAPWRFKYIEQKQSSGCFFVELPQQENDRENGIVFRGATAFVILNRYPYTNGHLMIAPYKHTAEMSDLNDEELLEIQKLLAASVRWIRAAYGAEGFNIGVNLGHAGGAGVPSHIHWHVVPRWVGDTNFMTTVGDVRVLPQTIEESFDKLRSVMEES